MTTNEEGRLMDNTPEYKPLAVQQRAKSLEKSDADRNGAVYQQPAAAPASSTNAIVYFHAIRRHWLLGLVLGVIVAAAFGAATYIFVPGYYTPFAYIRVAMSQESIVYEKSTSSINNYEVFKNTQLGLIKSPYVLMAALRKQDIANLSIVKQENDPLSWLQSELNALYINDSEIMRVSLTSKQSKEATDLVNAVVDAYIKEVVNKQDRERREISTQLAQLYASKENEVRSKRASLINLAEQLNASHSDAVKTQSTVNIQELHALRSALMNMQMKLGEADGKLRANQAMLERLDESPVSEIELEQLVRADPVCRKNSEMIAALRNAVTQQSQVALPGVNRSSADRLAQQLEATEQEYTIRENEFRELIKESKRAEIEEEIAAAQVQVTILTEQVNSLSVKVDEQREKVSEIGKSSVDIEMMASELDSLEKSLGEISAQREKLAVESRARPRITQEQPAQCPETVDKPHLALILAIMTSCIGFALPFSGIVFWDVRFNRINSTEDVAHGLGLPIIGSVPIIPGRAIRRLGSAKGSNLYWNVRLTESIDAIAAKLLRNATIDDKRTILVTSAVSGECKTTLATQIAMSLARAGRRTVLVDFDLRTPAINRSFQLELDPGVSESLCGEVNVGDAVCETGMDNLSVLTAGRSDHHALRALANGKDQKLFDELREDFEFVIVDGSPILPVADSRYLSQHVDTVILSVFRDFSRMPKVADACEVLESFGVDTPEIVVTSSSESDRGMDRAVAT